MSLPLVCTSNEYLRVSVLIHKRFFLLAESFQIEMQETGHVFHYFINCYFLYIHGLKIFNNCLGGGKGSLNTRSGIPARELQ